MATNEKARPAKAGLLRTKRANETPVSTQSTSSATYSAEAVIGAVRILDVWQGLGGGELRRGRGRAFWRNGDGFNVELYPTRNGWQDFAANEGGGVLGLIQTVQGCTRSEARLWLADFAGMPLTPNSPERRRRYAEASQRAAERAKLAAWWFESRCEELEKLKRLSNGDDGPFDEDALTAAAGELYRLQQLNLNNPNALREEFARASQSDPENTRRLIQAGRAQQEQETEVFGQIVAHPWVSQ